MITIFKDIFSKEPHYIELDKCLERIKNGNSKERVLNIRSTIDKEKANILKSNLPSICFSGKFSERKDDKLIEHSGFIVLDFDNVFDVETKKKEVFEHDFIQACWISPSGNGIKALAKIADVNNHRLHFQALQDVFKDIDKSGINESRVCYESWDSEILIKEAKQFTKIKKIEKVLEPIKNTDTYDIFKKILVWLSNNGSAFTSGERNHFIFKLAGACSRFGIYESDCYSYCSMEFNDSSFTNKEMQSAIKSAYKSNQFNTAQFENNILVDKVTRKEIEVEKIIDLNEKATNVIYGDEVKSEALKLYDNGYESAKSTYIDELDEYFKWKKSELSLLSGYGNYGKSTFLKYLLMLQIIKDNEKIAIFTPEESPAHEFYHDMVEMYFGCDCTPSNFKRPSKQEYERVYEIMAKHIFFVYPKTVMPTPQVVKESFLELIIKEKVSFCIVDPFNQLTNDYSTTGGRDDKYLETMLSDFTKFERDNNVFFVIVAHPKNAQKDGTGNYPCPDVFDLAGGAMWNNKTDNIMIYHLPNRQTNPDSTVCEIHTKKIRRRKIVGKIGKLEFEYVPFTRRFSFNGIDYVGKYNGYTNVIELPKPKIQKLDERYEKIAEDVRDELLEQMKYEFDTKIEDGNSLPF